MSQLSLSDLEQFPQSAIQISDGLVCGVNRAASALLPSLRQGCPPPAPLLPLLDDSTQPAGTVALSHTLFTYSRLPLEKGILLLLQPAPAQGVTPRQLDGFIRQARTLMQDLLLTVQLMESSSGEASRPDFWKTYCRTTRLLSNLQFMAQAAEEGVPFHPVTLDLAGLVRQTAAEAASLLELSHLSLDYHELPSSLLIPGDPALLRKLLLTLLSNGARATPPGGQLTVSLRQSPSRALLLVTDGGNSQPDWQTLFPSPAPSPMPAAPQDGAGMGLAIARHIVALHNGTMLLQPEGQPGLCWAVSLPTGPLNPHLSVRSPRQEELGGLSPVLTELSDVLPSAAFSDLE